MFRVSTEAAFGLRIGIVTLASVVALVTIFASAADARGKRKFFKRTSQSASSYEPRYADIVVDANTGDVLHSTNPDAQRHPASLTKIMTLYLLFERLEAGRVKLETQMDVSAYASSQAPTKLGVRPGQTLMVEDAIKALVTKSANDAAVVIAEHLGGSEDEFAKLMTRKARALRMTRTVYKNASGLPDESQVTTARDQALLGLAIQERFPRYYRYFATQSFAYRGVKMANHNRLLGRVEGVTGIKTGYTRMSGFNLVSAVQRGERRVVAVVLGGASAGARDAKMRSLIEAKTQLASVKRTAPRITEIADAAPMPAPVAAPIAQVEKPAPVAQAEKPARVAAPAKPQPAAKSAARAAEPQPVAAVSADQPAPGSTEPIRPLLVKTLSVKAAAVKTASATSMFAPEPMSARSSLVNAAQIEAPAPRAEAPKFDMPKPEARPEARAETLPPSPPGARPGVLGVLPAKDAPMDAAPRTMTASIAPVPPAPPAAKEPVREIAAKPAPAPVAFAPVAPPAPAKAEAAIPTSKPRSGWIVQVGAFEDVDEAKEKLAAARARIASILKDAEPYTEVFSKGDKRYYRARFAGLKESSAELACKELQKSKMACFAVRN
jgi:D-alanyl-D-alanine carboxypeptidase